MDEVHIPNRASYSPVSLLELAAVAPLAARVLFGLSPAGRALQAITMGAYLGTAAEDWLQRLRVRKIPFRETFGADVRHFEDVPADAREREIAVLVERLRDGHTDERRPRRELAGVVDHHLTAYIAGITGQRVETSREIREVSMIGFIFPFALGACDFISGDITILRDTGPLEPHILAHELCHRKGYFAELEAQALAYLAMAGSRDPALVQAARLERLHRNLTVLSDDDAADFRARLQALDLPDPLRDCLLALHPEPEERPPLEKLVSRGMRALYDERMRITGQNGLSDYDEGFLGFLYTAERDGRGPMADEARIWRG